MVRSRSKVLAAAVVLGVVIAIAAGAMVYVLRQAPSEVHVRVSEIRFSLDDGSGGAGADKSVFGRLARAVRSEVVVDSLIEVDSELPISATVESVTWTITVGGVDVGGGATPPGTEQVVAADGTSVITAQTRVPVTQIAKVLLHGSGPTVEVAGVARVRVWGFSIEQEFEADAAQVARGGTLEEVLAR